jgi:PAS domain S-box-containing protein
VVSAERLEIDGESCTLALTRDVTELKRAVAALRMTQFSVDHAAEAVLWIDSDGQIRYANATAAASLQYDPAALVGTPVFALNDSWTAPAWREFWTLVKREGAALRVCTLRTQRGQTYPAEVLCQHIATEGREQMVVGARDISERVAADRAVMAGCCHGLRSSPSGCQARRGGNRV